MVITSAQPRDRAAPALAPLRVRSLGGFKVWRGSKPLPAADWGQSKPASLFKLLLGAEGHCLHQERLADLLWPEAAPARGAASLRSALHQLRKVLDPPGAPVSYVLTAGSLRRLDPAPGAIPADDWWDAAAFERLARAALAREDAEACRAALTIYGGEYLPEEPYADWASDRRDYLRGLHRQLLLHLAGLCERAGEPVEAEGYLRAILATEPWQEEAAARLLILLGTRGRRTEGLAAYRELARAMREELGVAPSARTERLRARLAGDAGIHEEADRMGAGAVPGRATLPSGTVTFLLSDIEGSTALWERQPVAMRAALARHDAIFTDLLARHGGRLVKERGEGDSIFAVFASPSRAVAAACALQRAFVAEHWPGGLVLRVRMGLHSGEAGLREGDYYGGAVNRAARLRGLGHGGQVLLSQAVTELVRDELPEGIGLRSLGSHSLKGLGRPEAIYQLLHPALPDSFPPLLSPQASKGNLPAALTSFIGRETEIRDVRALLERHRLVTLTGEGGAGKTSLALAVAEEMLEAYADGIWLVELAPLADPGLVPGAVAHALGLREEPGRALQATLSEYLRERELLLLLDNCEHLVAACAALAGGLLRACTRLTILATSREGLGVAGERRWRVPLLGLPGAGRQVTLEQLGGFAAVRLFLERGQAVRPSFALTARNAWAVEQVCRRLDGLPLAIELAAGRLAALSVEQLAKVLDDRFRLLTGGSRGSLPHQQTLRATLDWSHDLLSAPERLLFRRLSVFAGGWTIEAAEAVCAGDGIGQQDILDLLGGLVQRSLARVEEEAGEPRHGLLETMRQYAAAQLAAADEEAPVRARHLAWCVRLAEEAEPRLSGPDQGRWLARLETEHDNLRAALGWSLDGGPCIEGLRLAGMLWRFWSMHGDWSEGRRWLEGLLQVAEGADAPGPLRARALNGAGNLAVRQGDYTRARAMYEESLAIRRELGDTEGIAASLNGLGNVADNQGDYARARALHEESLALRRALGATRGIAMSLNNLGNVAHRQGDLARARALHEESLALSRSLGDVSGIANSLINLGNVTLDQGDYARARALHEESLALRREVGDKEGIAKSLNNLGNVAHDQGDYARAQALHEESLSLRRELGDEDGIAQSLHNLGNVALDQGDLVRAWELHAESLSVRRMLGLQLGLAEALDGFARLARSQEQPLRSVQLWGAAAALRRLIGAPRPPNGLAEHERALAAARAALGEETYIAAWATGQALSLEEAIALALDRASSA